LGQDFASESREQYPKKSRLLEDFPRGKTTRPLCATTTLREYKGPQGDCK